MKKVDGFKYFYKKAKCLAGVYICHLPRKSAKMQLLNKLSEILHKFVSLVFFKIVVLKATSDSKPISNFNHLQQRSFLRRSRLQMFFKIGVPKNFANFTGKPQCWSLFYKVVQALGL